MLEQSPKVQVIVSGDRDETKVRTLSSSSSNGVMFERGGIECICHDCAKV